MFGNNQKFSLPLDLLSESHESDSNTDLLINSGESFHTPDTEGQLAVDVAQTDEELIITAPVAGADPNQVSLHLQNDVLTIRGERHSPVPDGAEYFYEECFWGKFSRTIVLPVDIKVELARAEFKNGVLTVRLPKLKAKSSIPIYIVEE